MTAITINGILQPSSCFINPPHIFCFQDGLTRANPFHTFKEKMMTRSSASLFLTLCRYQQHCALQDHLTSTKKNEIRAKIRLWSRMTRAKSTDPEITSPRRSFSIITSITSTLTSDMISPLSSPLLSPLWIPDVWPTNNRWRGGGGGDSKSSFA